MAFCEEEPEEITLKDHSGRRKNEGEWSNKLKKQRKMFKKEDEDGGEEEAMEGTAIFFNMNHFSGSWFRRCYFNYIDHFI